MKRIFAILLVVCLTASLFGITAFADEPATTNNVMTVSGLKDDGTTVVINSFTSFEEGWNYATELSTNKNDYMDNNGYKRIVVDLLANWQAKDHAFGDSDGFGFQWSTIYVPGKARLTLNMNGHTIDRNLGDKNELDGEVICVEKKADLIINGGKSGDDIVMAETETDILMGTIKGGNSDNGAGGIHIEDGANVTLNNVKISQNITDDDEGSGIAIYHGATLTMNGGGFIGNKNHSWDGSYAGAGIYVYGSTATFNNVLFRNNQFTYDRGVGAALYACANSTVTMDGCKVIDNGTENEDEGYLGSECTIYGVYTNFTIKNTTFTGNGDAKSDSDVIAIAYSNLTMDKCTFTNNIYEGFVIDSGHMRGFLITVTNSTFTDNNCGVLNGEIVSFTNCTFNNNFHGKDGKSFYSDDSIRCDVEQVFIDCQMGDSTFGKSPWVGYKYATFIDSDNPDGAPASIFGEGSLAMIVAILALIASVVSICITVAFNKKKAATVKAENE